MAGTASRERMAESQSMGMANGLKQIREVLEQAECCYDAWDCQLRLRVTFLTAPHCCSHEVLVPPQLFTARLPSYPFLRGSVVAELVCS